MRNGWAAEHGALKQFAADLEGRPPLPDAAQEDLDAHARQISHLQNLLSMVATLPSQDRPDVAAWDDVLGPLWRRLFAKGDDAARYILADLWRPVLLEEGHVERFLRACTAVAASARDFQHFEEALHVCSQARQAAKGEPSGTLANLINTEGTVHICREDWEAAVGCFHAAQAMAEALPEETVRWGAGLSKSDFHAQELLNILDTTLRRANRSQGAERRRAVEELRALQALLEAHPMSEGFARLFANNLAEIDALVGRFTDAKARLLDLISSAARHGPYGWSLISMHARCLSLIGCLENDWMEAYRWIRMALKEGVRRSYPGEDQFVLDQAVRVLRGLHEAQDVPAQEALVQDLVALLEDKDWYTGRSHSRSVSRLAVRIGGRLNEALGWNLDLDALRNAGLLHDIGKLRVPWSLLNKIAPITPKELRTLREHSLQGGRLLRQMGLDDTARVVEQHHEAMDGSGYPAGRAPDRDAAIIAVCDIYEATVTPNRRYKKPKSRVTALAELAAGGGSKYHPDVVDALMDLVRQDSAPGQP